MKTAWLTNIGGKVHNDDTASILEEKGTYVFVGDGLGAYAGGQQASQVASDVMMAQGKKGGLLEEGTLRSAAAAADQAVHRLQEETGGSMKTTMVFLAIEGGTARWMHIGDSRLYVFRKGKLQKQTQDHSVSQMAVLLGEIAQSQIRFHEDRSRILRALGGGNAKPDISQEWKIRRGDAFLLCTDGFWEFVYEAEMEQLLKSARTPEAWLKSMEKLLLTRIPENTDNYTAAAVFC